MSLLNFDIFKLYAKKTKDFFKEKLEVSNNYKKVKLFEYEGKAYVASIPRLYQNDIVYLAQDCDKLMMNKGYYMVDFTDSGYSDENPPSTIISENMIVSEIYYIAVNSNASFIQQENITKYITYLGSERLNVLEPVVNGLNQKSKETSEVINYLSLRERYLCPYFTVSSEDCQFIYKYHSETIRSILTGITCKASGSYSQSYIPVIETIHVHYNNNTQVILPTIKMKSLDFNSNYFINLIMDYDIYTPLSVLEGAIINLHVLKLHNDGSGFYIAPPNPVSGDWSSDECKVEQTKPLNELRILEQSEDSIHYKGRLVFDGISLKNSNDNSSYYGIFLSFDAGDGNAIQTFKTVSCNVTIEVLNSDMGSLEL